MWNGLVQLHVHKVFSSITSINFTLVCFYTHGKQDLKTQVSGLFNDTVAMKMCHEDTN